MGEGGGGEGGGGTHSFEKFCEGLLCMMGRMCLCMHACVCVCVCASL